MENNTENNNININKETIKEKIPFNSILIVVLVIIIGFLLLTRTSPKKEIIKENVARDIAPITENDHILGNKNAKVFIVEYSDTECPFCKVFHNTMHRIIVEKGEEVAWVYRHFPIPQLHALAFNEAVATECAFAGGGDEAFWLYTDQIYARTNSNDSLNPDELYKIAKDINLDVAKFTSCLQNQEYKNKVDAHVFDGLQAGVEGTPTSFVVVDGKVVDIIQGAQKYETVIQTINENL